MDRDHRRKSHALGFEDRLRQRGLGGARVCEARGVLLTHAGLPATAESLAALLELWPRLDEEERAAAS